MSADLPPPARPRPALARRLLAGGWHAPGGLFFLLRRPALWPLAVLPMLVTLACLAGSLALAAFLLGWVERSWQGRGLGGLFLVPVLWVGVLVTSLALGLAVSLLLASPVLERLSRKVAAVERGWAARAETGLRWEAWQALRAALYFLVRAPAFFLLGFLPLVGPLLALLWGAHALALQLTEMSLARRGRSFADRRAWHRHNRAESLGFGLVGLVLLVVPFANLLLTPALVAGGTRLVLELEGEAERDGPPPP
jgi:CysZ protein